MNKNPIRALFQTALLTQGRGDGRPARERDWCGKVTDELPRLAPPRAGRPCPSLRRRAGVSPAGEKLSISGETLELHPTPSKFFQNSATPFHAPLVLFLLFAATFPAFAQIPSKVTLSRANTPTADGFTVAWSDLSNETAYHLEHTTSANFTSSTLITNISANATSHALTGLTPGTTYYVRVRGAAAGGNGTWSDVQANQLLSIDPGQTRYLSVPGVPHGASHSVNFTISDVFGSANSAGLAAGSTNSEATTVMLLGADGSTAHTVFYNTSQNQWREGDTSKGSEIVGFGKGFMVKNNTSSADVFLLSGSVPTLEPGAVAVFSADAPAGRLGLVAPSRTMATSLPSLGLTNSNNTTTGLKRATTAKDADLLLIPDSAGGLRRYHFDGTNWRSGLRTVADPASVTVPAGGAFFLRKASGSSFEQWRPPSEVVTDGLILHLDAANPDSYPGNGTTWTDLSGNGNHGTLTNGPTFSSSNNGSIGFDGVNDFIELGNKDDFLFNTGNFSIFIWFKLPSTYSATFPVLISKGTFNTVGGFIFYVVENKLRLYIDAKPSTSTPFNGTTILNTNKWSYCGLVKDGSTVSLYWNSKLENSTTLSNININSTLSLTVGRRPDGQYFSGNISQVKIYNRALTSAEISQNYKATMSRFEDPDARSYLDAVEAADGQGLEAGVRDAVDKFVKGCKVDGTWSAIKASCILAGARTLNGALVPLVGTAPTNYNFVSGDYHRENGLLGNASTKYLDSNRANNADPQDNNHNSVYIHTIDTYGPGGLYMGAGGAGNGANNLVRPNSSWQHGSRSRSSTRTDTGANPPPAGFFGISRSTGISYIHRQGGTNTTVSATSQASSSDDLFVFARNNGSGSPQFPSNSRLQFYSIGESLDLAKLDSRVSTLLTDLAAAIP